MTEDDAVVELDEEQCWKPLHANSLGRLAIATSDGADIFPINYVGSEGHLYLRTAPGSKLLGLTVSVPPGSSPALIASTDVLSESTSRPLTNGQPAAPVLKFTLICPWLSAVAGNDWTTALSLPPAAATMSVRAGQPGRRHDFGSRRQFGLGISAASSRRSALRRLPASGFRHRVHTDSSSRRSRHRVPGDSSAGTSRQMRA